MRIVKFGEHIRQRRETLRETLGGEFSLRGVAKKLDVSPAFLSQVENGTAMPSNEGIDNIASVLREDREVLLALAGRMPSDVARIVLASPSIAAEMFGLVRALDGASEDRIRSVTEKVTKLREGEW